MTTAALSDGCGQALQGVAAVKPNAFCPQSISRPPAKVSIIRISSTGGACRAGATSRSCPPRPSPGPRNVSTFGPIDAVSEHLEPAERRSTAIVGGALCRGGAEIAQIGPERAGAGPDGPEVG